MTSMRSKSKEASALLHNYLKEEVYSSEKKMIDLRQADKTTHVDKGV